MLYSRRGFLEVKLPEDFKKKYQALLGDQAPAFFESLSGEVQKGFRLNPLKDNYKNVADSLAEPVEYVATGYVGEVSGKTLEHQAGYVYSQDLSAMYVGEVVEAKPGEKILDLCAAPGGKSTQIIEKMANQGLLVSNEINKKRALILAENMERTGARNSIVLNEDPATLAQNFKAYFDKIVVDAPCSGEGMFRKDPHAITYWHADYPAQCAKRQREILAEAVKMLAVGGELIYSTCTFAPEEDEQIISWLLQEYPYFEIVPLQKYTGMDSGNPAWGNDDPALTGTVRLMPHHFKGEGHFIAKLRDTRPAQVVKTKKNKRKKQNKAGLTQEQVALWKEFSTNFLKQDLFKVTELQCYGDHLYYYNKDWPDISRLKFMRPGLLLGVFKKKRFEPSYTLALALSATETEQKLVLTHEQWQQYVAGNTVTVATPQKNGWYLLICDDKPFAFGKVVNGTVKNFFPKGLRFSFE